MMPNSPYRGTVRPLIALDLQRSQSIKIAFQFIGNIFNDYRVLLLPMG